MSVVPEGTIPYLEGRASQPAALERVTARVAERIGALDAPLDALRPLFVGIGASHAALALPVRLLAEHGVPARRALAGDLGPRPATDDADLVVGVSQSGRSTETLDALAHVGRERSAALVNTAPSPLASLAGRVVDLGSEPDSYASTIGYTGTLVGLALVAHALAGLPPAGAAGEWAGIGERLERYERAVGPVVDEIAARASSVVAADLVGAGAGRSVAEEGALLLREVCRVPAAAMVTRNYLHGAMESAGRTLHVVVGDGREVRLARTLAAAGHLTLAVTSAPLTGKDVPGGALFVAPVPGDVPLAVRTVLETAVVQRLAGSLAAARGVEIEEFVFESDDTKTQETLA
ncbi:SIS domain-containing protein [Streptomyces fuscigenes]|uniref:SIS domain-containing protein n=1 Tax=Streptomyces fuscigenes TaxID=1528880 RepID=UPI001F46541F|nr:SIS domain-containing protein [Streptomyces fuscigenes]MCF3965023.1 SIS domain-containing protein [Streptomyces fuscigenes]